MELNMQCASCSQPLGMCNMINACYSISVIIDFVLAHIYIHYTPVDTSCVAGSWLIATHLSNALSFYTFDLGSVKD